MAGLDFSIIKKKPVTSGAVIIGGALILFLLMRAGGGGASAGGGSTGGISDAQANAAAQVQIAQLQAGAQGASYNFQLAALDRQLTGDFAVAGLSAQLQQGMAQLQADLTRYQVGEDSRIAELNISAQRDMTLAGYQNQQALAMTQSQMQLGLAGIQAETAMFTVGTNADLQATLARLQSDTTLGLANIQAGTARRQSSNNLIGSIIGGAFSLFSDMRLKENIRSRGFSADGFALYEYNYVGSTERHVGVMAHEVAHTGAVQNWNGYSVVNYGALAA